ncbi:MAG: hypothetical protein OEV87_13330 [Phycisphaerae bacterium]|nr:hypothetical protein [Phycisphaerae bacterium]
MSVSKKKVIKSLEGLDEMLKDLLKKQYPNGYESCVTRIINAKKEHIFVFPLETEDATYLIKVPSTKNSDGEYNVDFGKKGEFDKPEDVDEFSSENDDLETSDSDFDSDDGDGGAKEPGYDPDFDN